jgi:hypothetical protein
VFAAAAGNLEHAHAAPFHVAEGELGSDPEVAGDAPRLDAGWKPDRRW